MSLWNGALQIGLFFLVLLILVKPLGWYIAQVFQGKNLSFMRCLYPIERAIYGLCGIQPKQEMDWRQYARAMLWFNALSFVSNTNWQAYAGETTLSYATQMLALIRFTLPIQYFIWGWIGQWM